MRQNTNYLLIGVFVIVATGVGIGTALFLGAGALASKSRMLETYIRESVQGLEVGAHVRFRGVKIGQVKEITFTSHVYGSADPWVLVRFEVEPDRGVTIDELDEVIEERLEKGLRAQLASQGLTGALYLEADVYDDADTRFPPIEHDWTPQYRYVPSIPSKITQLSRAATEVLANLEQSDIAAMIEEARLALASGRRAFDGLDTAELSDRLERLADSASDVLERSSAAIARVEGGVLGVVDDVRARLQPIDPEEIRALLTDLRGFAAELEPVGRSLQSTLEQAEQTVVASRRAVEGRGREIDQLLDDVRRIASSLANLAETLEQYPSLLFLGNPPKESGR